MSVSTSELSSLTISDIKRTEKNGQTEVSADIGGFRLRFQLPTRFCRGNIADAFFISSFFPAAASGAQIRLQDGYYVSRQLCAQVEELQPIVQRWVPGLKQVFIDVQHRESCLGLDAVATTFSGGIDSLHTLVEHRDEITHLFNIEGFDFDMSEREYRESIARLGRVAKRFDKQLVPIRTNARAFFTHWRIGRLINHGALLAAVSHLIGPRRVYIPSSDHYGGLVPWGTHPLTDPLWSTEATEVVPDAYDVTRVQKTRTLVDVEGALKELIVCHRYAARNCGRCGKCLRTLATLELLGANVSQFPAIRLRHLLILNLQTPVDVEVLEEVLKLAREQGSGRYLRALALPILRFRLRNICKSLLKGFDDVVLRGGVADTKAQRRRRANSKAWYELRKP